MDMVEARVVDEIFLYTATRLDVATMTSNEISEELNALHVINLAIMQQSAEAI